MTQDIMAITSQTCFVFIYFEETYIGGGNTEITSMSTINNIKKVFYNGFGLIRI